MKRILWLVTNIKHCIRSLELQHLNNDSWVTLIRQIPVFIQILTELNEWNNKEKDYIKNDSEDPFQLSSLERKDEIRESLSEITELKRGLDSWVHLVSKKT